MKKPKCAICEKEMVWGTVYDIMNEPTTTWVCHKCKDTVQLKD